MTHTTAAIIPTSVKLDSKLKARLKKLGKQKHRTVHWLMKDAIRRYIAVEEEAVNLRKETLDRWEDVDQEKTVNHKAVSAWLASWGTTKEKPRPACGKKGN